MATPPVFSAGAVLTAAQMNAVGMWRVSTKTFSAAADVTFDGVFTSDFRHYRIVFDAKHSATYVSLNYRLRASNADNTTANYWWRATYSSNTTTFYTAGDAQTAGFWANIPTVTNGMSFDVFCPQVTERTSFAGTYYDHNNPFVWNIGSGFVATTQFDGIKIYLPSGTMTGQATVYGYND
jgi:hypothetical protein